MSGVKACGGEGAGGREGTFVGEVQEPATAVAVGMRWYP
jgi:hypothetical protein